MPATSIIKNSHSYSIAAQWKLRIQRVAAPVIMTAGLSTSSTAIVDDFFFQSRALAGN